VKIRSAAREETRCKRIGSAPLPFRAKAAVDRVRARPIPPSATFLFATRGQWPRRLFGAAPDHHERAHVSGLEGEVRLRGRLRAGHRAEPPSPSYASRLGGSVQSSALANRSRLLTPGHGRRSASFGNALAWWRVALAD